MEVRKNTLAKLTVCDVNNKGYGVARLEDDGRVVFVSNAVTGETVEAKIIKVASDYLVARVEKRLNDSPHRLASDCPAFPACGGCVTRHITYAHELSLKTEYVKNAFRKARLTLTVANCEGGKETGYRNKTECPLTKDYAVGFFAPKSHDVISCVGCKHESPLLAPVAKTVTAWLKKERIPLYDEAVGKGLLRHLYLRIAEGTGEVMVTLVINGKSMKKARAFADEVMAEHPEVVSVMLNHNEEKTNVILGRDFTLVGGRDYIEDTLCGMRFRLAPPSFYQVNRDMAERLYRKALTLAELQKEDTLADLFCGVGTIGLFMLKESGAKALLGVEIVPEAVENAKVNAALNGIDNAVFICGDANSEELNTADVIVVDPPRKGCGEALLKRIAEIAPRRLVYISCNPDTLARDVAILQGLGYEAGVVYPFDLFPRTGHVESVVCLTRSDKAT